MFILMHIRRRSGEISFVPYVVYGFTIDPDSWWPDVDSVYDRYMKYLLWLPQRTDWPQFILRRSLKSNREYCSDWLSVPITGVHIMKAIREQPVVLFSFDQYRQ